MLTQPQARAAINLHLLHIAEELARQNALSSYIKPLTERVAEALLVDGVSLKLTLEQLCGRLRALSCALRLTDLSTIECAESLLIAAHVAPHMKSYEEVEEQVLSELHKLAKNLTAEQLKQLDALMSAVFAVLQGPSEPPPSSTSVALDSAVDAEERGAHEDAHEEREPLMDRYMRTLSTAVAVERAPRFPLTLSALGLLAHPRAQHARAQHARAPLCVIMPTTRRATRH